MYFLICFFKLIYLITTIILVLCMHVYNNNNNIFQSLKSNFFLVIKMAFISADVSRGWSFWLNDIGWSKPLRKLIVIKYLIKCWNCISLFGQCFYIWWICFFCHSGDSLAISQDTFWQQFILCIHVYTVLIYTKIVYYMWKEWAKNLFEHWKFSPTEINFPKSECISGVFFFL